MKDNAKQIIKNQNRSNIRKCLEDGCVDMGKTLEPSSEERVNILKARAGALAKRSSIKDQDDVQLEVVEFHLAHETYAFELEHILEVLPLKELTPLPCTPPFVLGIINFRGQIISIIDLKKFFELPEQGLNDLNWVIILQTDEPVRHKPEGMEFGILADSIIGVNTIPLSTVQTTLPTLTGVGAKYLLGITGDRVVILDGGKILSDEKIVVHEEIEL